MYLKRIELIGFKSFAKKTNLEFTSAVTAIVGPNGSGKSNVVEAVRFVLGEQSMKTMRTREGRDLIWKGSPALSKSSRAAVSLILDNRGKTLSFGKDEGGTTLSYDELSLTREVGADGKNKYSLNGSEVRLKDIVEILGQLHIGSSAHHIISQGEADSLLRANARERKDMLEDALGLSVYHSRIKESERKLERTAENLKEAKSLRRELAPHLLFLKKQVEKIEKMDALRDELAEKFSLYAGSEEKTIFKLKEDLENEVKNIEKKIKEFAERLEKLEAHDAGGEKDAGELVGRYQAASKKREEIISSIAKLRGMLEVYEKGAEEEKELTVSRREYEERVRDILDKAQKGEKEESVASLRAVMSEIRSVAQMLLSWVESGETNARSVEKEELEKKLENLLAEEKKADSETQNLFLALKEGEKSRASWAEKIRDAERKRTEILIERERLEGRKTALLSEKGAVEERRRRFEENTREILALIGGGASSRGSAEILSEAEQEKLRKDIERMKIKLEEAGVVGAGETMKEFQETSERDTFLGKEIEDLEKSASQLVETIAELKRHLEEEFKEGIEKINKVFSEFFALMFGGGSAFLSVVLEAKRKRRMEEGEESEENNEEVEKEEGIEINVNLPRKKVRDLTLLSGGERSLTSIALLFAMSQVNPPPFLVLDETDAALDEANSRKYGDMLEKLSTKSQLIVVTHNRETMSRANVLYGVTIGSEGASRLLSVKFEEAAAIAK